MLQLEEILHHWVSIPTHPIIMSKVMADNIVVQGVSKKGYPPKEAP